MASKNPYFSKKIIRLFFFYLSIALILWVLNASLLVPPRVQEFFYSDKAGQEEMAEQLIRMDRVVIRSLSRLLNYADSATFSLGTEVLRQINPSTVRLTQKDFDGLIDRTKLLRVARLKDTTVVLELSNLLYGRSIIKKTHIPEALGIIGSKDAVDPLIYALSSSNYDIKSDAIEALGRIGDPAALDALLSILDERSYQFRLTTIIALGEIGAMEAVDPLIDEYSRVESIGRGESYYEEKAALMLAIYDALGNMGGSKVRRFLAGTLKYEESPMEIKALETLGRCGDSSTLGQLFQYTRTICRKPADERQKVDRDLLNALADAMTDIDSDAAKSHYSQEFRRISRKNRLTCNDILALWTGSRIMANTGDKTAISYLSRYYDSSNTGLAIQTIEAASSLGDSNAVTHLIQRMEESDEDLLSILSALYRIKDHRAVAPIVNLLNEEDKKDLNIACVLTLGELGDPRVVETLLDFHDKSWEVSKRYVAKLTITKLGDETYLEPSIELFLNNPDYWAMAKDALIKSESLQALKILTRIVGKSEAKEEVKVMAAEVINQVKANRSIGAY